MHACSALAALNLTCVPGRRLGTIMLGMGLFCWTTQSLWSKPHIKVCRFTRCCMHVHCMCCSCNRIEQLAAAGHNLGSTHPHGLSSSIVPHAGVAVGASRWLAEEGPAASSDTGHASRGPAAPAGLGWCCGTQAWGGTNCNKRHGVATKDQR
jgi:hypothetical protein